MPSRVTFTYRTYIEIGLYVALLFFVVPIRIEKDYELRTQFLKYLEDFNKSYADKETFNVRFEAFKKSLDNINALNKNKTIKSAQYGLTKFSDLSHEEFMALHNKQPFVANASGKFNIHVSRQSTYWHSVPKQVDWREKGVVSNIIYQKNCGACWAFAVTETIESMQAIKTHSLTKLSAQQMIDCSTYNTGCQGGDICSLLLWIKSHNRPLVDVEGPLVPLTHNLSIYLLWIKDFNVKIAHEIDYPLKLKDQKCQKTDVKTGVQISDFACDNYIGREDIILKLLAENGPVAVAVSGETWQNYIGGVIQYHCDGEISHAVQIVGYDLTKEIPYYIVRNSWGEDFGDNGYLYVTVGGNVCNLAFEVASVTVV